MCTGSSTEVIAGKFPRKFPRKSPQIIAENFAENLPRMDSDHDENGENALPNPPNPTMEDRMEKMMDLVMETMIAMKNMQHENQMLTKQMLYLTKDKLNM